MELKAEVHGISIYDDFAHHPTAIALTLEGVRKRMNSDNHGRLIAVIEPRSNTMRPVRASPSVVRSSYCMRYDPHVRMPLASR